MDFRIPEELEMVRQTARRFVNEEFRPIEREIDETDRVDPQVMRRLRLRAAELGIYAHNLPMSIGGGGLSALGQVVIAEELGKSTVTLCRTAGFLPSMLTDCHTHQRSWFLDPLVKGESVLAYAVTEPDGGSDIGSMKTKAVRKDGGWVINGSKAFVSNVQLADFIVVVAITDPSAPLRGRFTLFIVERNHPGFHYLRAIKKMGWRGGDFSAFSLDDCFVDDGHVLGEVNQGFNSIMKTINSTRIHLGGYYVGMAEELLSQACAYAKQRKTFGKRLADHQAIQFMIADSDMEMEAARLLTYRAAMAADEGHADMRITASRAKCYAGEMTGRVADRVMQIFGAAGYTCDYTIERMYRDSRAFRIGEGTSEMQRMQIARNLLD